MLEYGSFTSIPAKYRITLAISVALLLHTLAVALLPLLMPVPEREAATLRFTLVQPGSVPSPQQPETADIQQLEPTDISREEQATEHEQELEASDAVTSTVPQSVNSPSQEYLTRPDSEPEQAHRDDTLTDATEEASSSVASPASQPASAGSATEEITEATKRADVARTAEQPEETSYLDRLAEQISRELAKRPVPTPRELPEAITVEVELQLMKNGVLTRASITRSSGYERVDQAAYRGALSASPYPPPEAGGAGNRFRVELVFSPERL